MYAIVDIAGTQFKVKEKDKIYVPLLNENTGNKITLDKVLLFSDGEKIEIGKPFLKEHTVEATVLENVKDDKVLVFKKKRRKGYKKLNGHRQNLTKISIEKIN